MFKKFKDKLIAAGMTPLERAGFIVVTLCGTVWAVIVIIGVITTMS